jgi:hypothetical protein
MRLPLLAGALVALGITALPAHAAIYPVCGASLVNAASGTTTYCFAGAAPNNLRSDRTFAVTTATGKVDVTLTCHSSVSGDSTAHTVVDATNGPARGSVGLRLYTGSTCTGTLTALAEGTTAYGFSTFVPQIPLEQL